MATQHLKVDEDEKKKSDSISSLMSDDDGATSEAIPFSMNVKHTIAKLQKQEARKIMIAMDNSQFSQKAIDWVRDNLIRDSDAMLLISIWEEAMVNQLVDELDSAIIHPDVKKSHSQQNSNQLHNTFSQAICFKNHKKLTALLVESNARMSSKTIGEELCEYADKMAIDILVCGTRGLGGLKKAVLGSVSTYVSSNAKCTTIIVK